MCIKFLDTISKLLSMILKFRLEFLNFNGFLENNYIKKYHICYKFQ